MRPSSHPLTRMFISSFAGSAGPDLRTSRPIQPKQTPQRSSRTCCTAGWVASAGHSTNVDEGWSRDVSEAMARKVHEIAEREDYELTEGTLAFMEAHSPRVVQPTLPLW
jgi:hypothetical protein